MMNKEHLKPIATTKTIVNEEAMDAVNRNVKTVKYSFGLTILTIGVLFAIIGIYVLNSTFVSSIGFGFVFTSLLLLFVSYNSKKNMSGTAHRVLRVLPNRVSTYTFYDEFIYVYSTGDLDSGDCHIFYYDIDNVLEDEDYYIIHFLNNIYVIDKRPLDGDIELVDKLLKERIKEDLNE